jgi:hypothetical protein
MLGFGVGRLGAGLGFDARAGVCVLVLVGSLVLRLGTALGLGVALRLDTMLRRGISRGSGVRLGAWGCRRRPVLVARVRRGRLNAGTGSGAFVWLTRGFGAAEAYSVICPLARMDVPNGLAWWRARAWARAGRASMTY